MPAYMQSTQLRSLFLNVQKIKTSEIAKSAIKTCLTRVRSLNTEKNQNMLARII